MFAARSIKSDTHSSSPANHANTPFFQPKQETGKPGDRFEVEADNVADQVVEKTQNQNTFLGPASFFPSVQPAGLTNPAEEEISGTEEPVEGAPEESVNPVLQFSPDGDGWDETAQGKCAECEREEEAVQGACAECEEEMAVQTKLEDQTGEIPEVREHPSGEMISRYPEPECEDGDVIDRAQTVVWFEFDSTNFRNDSEVDSTTHFLLLFREINAYLDMAGTDGIIMIHGYASEEGDSSHNHTLSLERALRIRSLLAALGIPAEQMIPIGHGENADYETLEYNRRVEVTYYPPVTCMVFDPLPITGSVTVLDCSDGRDINNNGDHDFDKVEHRPDDRSPDIWIYDNLLGESGALSDFQIGFFGGTFGVDTTDDNRLFDNFVTGSGAQIDFSTGSDMAREIGGTDAFTTFGDEFEASVRAYFDAHDTLHGFDCQAELIRTRPNYIGGTDSLFSWAVMGGYQRLEAHIDLSSGEMDITYRVFDHYGAGVSDAWSYLPGLSGLYYLQHYVTDSTSTYVPFIWSVNINRRNSL